MATLITDYDIRQRERLFRTVFENSPDAIFIEDIEGYVLEVNPAACRLHGLTREELIGKNVAELVPPECRESVNRFDQSVDSEVEGYSLAADGTRIPVSIRCSRIQYMNTTAVLLHVRDIGERKKTQKALQESEARYRLLFEAHPQPMWVHDIDTRRFIAVNEAALRLYRYSRDEFLHLESIDRILAQPRHEEMELPRLANVVQVTSAIHRRKDGMRLTLELTQHTMTLDGRIVAFVMVGRVISSSR